MSARLRNNPNRSYSIAGLCGRWFSLTLASVGNMQSVQAAGSAWSSPRAGFSEVRASSGKSNETISRIRVSD